MKVQNLRKRLANVVFALEVGVLSVVVFFVGMTAVHFVGEMIGTNTAGLYLYGSPNGNNWGVAFFDIGGLELNGPDGTTFFACTDQC